MRADNFNEQAMEEKIKNNITKGFIIEKIVLALKEEKLSLLKKMRVMEARVLELSDQLDYIKEKYDRS